MIKRGTVLGQIVARLQVFFIIIFSYKRIILLIINNFIINSFIFLIFTFHVSLVSSLMILTTLPNWHVFDNNSTLTTSRRFNSNLDYKEKFTYLNISKLKNILNTFLNSQLTLIIFFSGLNKLGTNPAIFFNRLFPFPNLQYFFYHH